MEKSKAKKPKTIQMNYPAAYSHSWASPQTEKRDNKKKKAKKNPSDLPTTAAPGCCRRSKTRPLFASNSYAPHLKYGIFPQQSSKIRSISATVNTNMAASNSANNEIMESADDKLDDKKFNKAKLSDAPLFVIRPIDKRNRRQLSTSETLHLDIKPQRNLIGSPTFPYRKPSPLIRNTIPITNYNKE